MGTITFIAKEGDYSIDEPIYEIEFNDQKKEYGMLQYWPVRTPRPFVSKIPSFTPLATGFRIVDTLFPFLFYFIILFLYYLFILFNFENNN